MSLFISDVNDNVDNKLDCSENQPYPGKTKLLKDIVCEEDGKCAHPATFGRKCLKRSPRQY
jgi:hypothetical protein